MVMDGTHSALTPLLRCPGVVWFTGLSGSGKSTIADRVNDELGRRGIDVELMDGDVLRSVFPQTGFSREDRDAHIRRVGYMAGLLEKHGVLVLATFVSPYEAARQAARALCRRFVEVYVATPLEECERRDVKGLYGRARRGEILQFTGISDPYEPPSNPELTLDTTGRSIEGAAGRVVDELVRRGMIPAEGERAV